MHGLSFAKPQAPESLLAKYRPPVDGAINEAGPNCDGEG
jgi:exonuclease SbcD